MMSKSTRLMGNRFVTVPRQGTHDDRHSSCLFSDALQVARQPPQYSVLLQSSIMALAFSSKGLV